MRYMQPKKVGVTCARRTSFVSSIDISRVVLMHPSAARQQVFAHTDPVRCAEALLLDEPPHVLWSQRDTPAFGRS